MEDQNNDIYLLKKNPDQLVLKYIPVVESLVIKKLIKPGYFKQQDKDDKVQEILESLLNDIKKIRKNYNGYSSFRPYFVQIINNRCREIKRKAYRQKSIITLKDDPDTPEYENKMFYSKKYDHLEFKDTVLSDVSNYPDRNLIINSELEYLDVIFRFFSLQKPKLIICLKVILGFPVLHEELTEYYNRCEKGYYDSFIELVAEKEGYTLEERYQILTDFFNYCDRTNKQKDAIRKWITKLLSEIITLLNKDVSPPVYSKQNIMGLIWFYFDKKSNSNS